MSIYKYVPLWLIRLRVLSGLAILLLAAQEAVYFGVYAVILFSFGLLTDIFDGIIARRLGISTPKLRRLDSLADLVFFALTGTALFVRFPSFFGEYFVEITGLLIAEALTYLLCFLKFRKEVSTHAIASKVWTLLLFAFMIELMLTGTSRNLFLWGFYVGIITRFEILVIILALRSWVTDVPSVIHAFRLRRGQEIRRNRWFNG